MFRKIQDMTCSLPRKNAQNKFCRDQISSKNVWFGKPCFKNELVATNLIKIEFVAKVIRATNYLSGQCCQSRKVRGMSFRCFNVLTAEGLHARRTCSSLDKCAPSSFQALTYAKGSSGPCSHELAVRLREQLKWKGHLPIQRL